MVLTFAALYTDWKVYLFDDEFAGIIGVNVPLMENIMMVLIAITVVVLIRVVGIILVLALLTAPAATAALFTARLTPRVLLSVALGGVFSFTGLWLSYRINIASGAAIVFVSVLVYLLCFAAKALYTRVKSAPAQ